MHLHVHTYREMFDVCITTYEMVVADVHGFVPRYMWSYVVMDEAHRIKNENSLLGQVCVYVYICMRVCVYV